MIIKRSLNIILHIRMLKYIELCYYLTHAESSLTGVAMEQSNGHKQIEPMSEEGTSKSLYEKLQVDIKLRIL